MCSSKYNVLSICTPNSLYLLDSQILAFLHYQFFPRYFHVCILQQVNDIYLHSVSNSCSETTQLLRNYHVPIYLSEIIGLYHRQKKWCHHQNYILCNQLEKINHLNKYLREVGLKLILELNPVITWSIYQNFYLF